MIPRNGSSDAEGGENPRASRSETIRIMGEIDEVIDAHGGWPDAFITDPAELEKLKGHT